MRPACSCWHSTTLFLYDSVVVRLVVVLQGSLTASRLGSSDFRNSPASVCLLSLTGIQACFTGFLKAVRVQQQGTCYQVCPEAHALQVGVIFTKLYNLQSISMGCERACKHAHPTWSGAESSRVPTFCLFSG